MSAPDSPTGTPARCDTCRALCCRLTVVLQPEDAVPAHLTTQLDNGLRVMARGPGGWCVAMDDSRWNCSIYPDRPSVCRRFVMDAPYCRAIREQDAGPDVAPDVGKP